MACRIEITKVTGHRLGTGSVADRIVVQGTATECAGDIVDVFVGWIWDGTQVQIPMQAAVVNGNWLVVIQTHASATCGENVTVYAKCASNKECSATVTLPLECGVCPTTATLRVTHDGATIGVPAACLGPGDYLIEVAPPGPAGTHYYWSVEGVPLGEDAPAFLHHLAAGETDGISVVIISPNCPALAAGITLTGCPSGCGTPTLEITDQAGDDVDPYDGCVDPGVYTFVVGGASPGSSYVWSVDGVATATTGPALGVTVSAGAVHNVAVAIVLGTCVSSFTIRIAGCAQGHDGPPTTPPPPTVPSSGGGFSICALLLGIWMAAFIAAAWFEFFGNVTGAAASHAAYVVALGIWIAKCCWPCAKWPWKCCTLLQWHFIALAIVVATMGNTLWVVNLINTTRAAGAEAGNAAANTPPPIESGNPVVLSVYAGLLVLFVSAMLALGRCAVPNFLDPHSYPGAKCRKRR